MFLISSNANGLRAREVRHAVDHAHAHVNLGRLRCGAACPQAVSRERLEAIHRVFRERAPMVATCLLLFVAADSGDRIVAPRRAACGDRSVAWLGVVGPITADDIEWLVARDLIGQFGQEVAVGNVLVRHQRGTRLTGVRVEPEMHFAPRAALRIAMLTYLPFALAVDFHAGAVDYQMDRLAVANDRQLDFKRLRTAAERRVTRHGQGGETRS